MEGQVPASQPPEFNTPPSMTPENIQALKEEARRRAIAQAMQDRKAAEEAAPPQRPQPQYVPQVPISPQPFVPVQAPEPTVIRRNLTIAEVGLLVALSLGIFTGIQFAWNFSTDILSRIEIREK
jgi:hypothetical protein